MQINEAIFYELFHIFTLYFFQVGTIFPGRYINITERIPPEDVPGHHLEHKKYIITTILVSFMRKVNFVPSLVFAVYPMYRDITASLELV